MVEIVYTSGSIVGSSFPYEEIINLTSQLHSMSVPPLLFLTLRETRSWKSHEKESHWVNMAHSFLVPAMQSLLVILLSKQSTDGSIHGNKKRVSNQFKIRKADSKISPSISIEIR